MVLGTCEKPAVVGTSAIDDSKSVVAFELVELVELVYFDKSRYSKKPPARRRTHYCIFRFTSDGQLQCCKSIDRICTCLFTTACRSKCTISGGGVDEKRARC